MALGFKMGASGSNGAKVYVDDELMSPQPSEVKIESTPLTQRGFVKSYLSSNVSQGYVVELNGEQYFICSNKMFKLVGDFWELLPTTLPYIIYSNGYLSAVVSYDNKIHLIGGQFNEREHWVFDGTSWSQLSVSLPYDYMAGACVVFQNRIYLIGGWYYNKRVSYYDGTWHVLSDKPNTSTQNRAIATSSGIYNFYGTKIEFYNGTSWTTLTTNSNVSLDQNCPFLKDVNGNLYTLKSGTLWKNGYYGSWSSVYSTPVSLTSCGMYLDRENRKHSIYAYSSNTSAYSNADYNLDAEISNVIVSIT